MTLEEAKVELEKFVKLKTSMRPAFVQPLLDAKEVKHGEWVTDTDNDIPMLRCSVCGSRAQKYNYMASVGTKGLSYCPYCGAQMLEDVDLTQTSLFMKYPGIREV